MARGNLASVLFAGTLVCSIVRALPSLTPTQLEIIDGLAAAAPDALGAIAEATPRPAPTATVRNGTYAGVYSFEWDQDMFLGVPYAQAPMDELRFRVPQPLNHSWEDTMPANVYSPECLGFGGDEVGYTQAEDCLYLNVIRPASTNATDLPVALWIHGGGFYEGGTMDKRYNLSFIVEQSVQIGSPMIGVSINYRLSAWGFLGGSDVMDSGNTNLGLRDQRLAMQWVQENIAAFGGDASKVTIWGESAGAMSVGLHLVAYSGRDDQLFRAAIMESGNPVPYMALNGTEWNDQLYHKVAQGTNCTKSANSLECMRHADSQTLQDAVMAVGDGMEFFPYIDGDFLAEYPSEQLSAGAFVHVPILSGANSDEGTAFMDSQIGDEAAFMRFLRVYSPIVGVQLPAEFADDIARAYPFDLCNEIPADLGCDVTYFPYGKMWRRAATYQGDAVFIAARRLTCETWADAGMDAYCYRFNARPYANPLVIGVTHFTEVAFVFDNTHGEGYATEANPFGNGEPASYIQLADLMSRTWASFIATLDPNAWRSGNESYFANSTEAPAWARYDTGNPQVMVWDANVTSYLEADTFRAEGMKLINDNARKVYRR